MAPTKAIRREVPDHPIVLAVVGSKDSASRLRHVFHGSNWTLHAVETVAEAVQWQRRNAAPVIVSEMWLPDGDWNHILGLAREAVPPSNVVFVSSTASDRLWLDLLKAGAHTLVTRLEDRMEVFPAISLAWRNWKQKLDARWLSACA